MPLCHVRPAPPITNSSCAARLPELVSSHANAALACSLASRYYQFGSIQIPYAPSGFASFLVRLPLLITSLIQIRRFAPQLTVGFLDVDVVKKVDNSKKDYIWYRWQ